MSLYNELDGLPFQELRELFDADQSKIPRGFEDDEIEWYEDIAFKLAESGNSGTDFLLSRIPASNHAQTRAILFALSVPSDRDQEVRRTLLRFIHSDEPAFIMSAIFSAKRLGYRDFLDEILPLKDHEDKYVRRSVLRFLSAHYFDIAKPLLVEALDSDDLITLQIGIEELGEHKCVDMLDRIGEFEAHTDENVRNTAHLALWAFSIRHGS